MRSSILKRFAALAAVAVAFSCADAPTAPDRTLTSTFTPRAAVSITYPAVLISQVYGGGGNSGATLRNDFIELFNPGTAAVDVTGWRVGYASSAGTSWQFTTLTGSIPAGGYYLIQQAAGTGGTASLPTPNATGTIPMSATSGKVILATGAATFAGVACPAGADVIDKVGFGTSANCTGVWGANTPAVSNTLAAIRADNGCAYSNPIAAADFTAGTPAPRNTASPVNPCSGDTPVVASVTVAPNASEIFVGAQANLTASAFDAENNPAPATFTWSSSNDAVATVNASGVVTGVAAGSVTITATAENGVFGSATVTVNEVPPPPPAIDVVISQVYGGGGNSGAFYTHDYVELYNRGDAPVVLDGWSVQYSSAAGTSWQANALTGTIEPGRYFLVRLAAGAGGTSPLPTPDATGSLAMGATSGKVALSSAAAALTGPCPVGPEVIDRVAYGASSSPDGCGGIWGRTANLGNTLAAFRLNDGCVDTGSSSADFVVLSPNPRNSASPRKFCSEPPREESAAELQINELMGDPVNAESASWGEWFEVHNSGASPLNLQGWTIISGGTSQPHHVINAAVVVPAGGYAVLGRGADVLRNGGVTLDYNYFTGTASTIWLDDADYLMLLDGEGKRVDSVAWTSLPRGIARGLRPGLGPKADVNGSDWAFATSSFGDGDYGTPGALNAPLSDVPPFVSPNRLSFSGRSAADAPLPIGFEAQVFVSLLDANGADISNTTTFTWTSLTPDLGSVDSRGVVRALGEGTARFRATAGDGTTRVVSLPFITPVAGGVLYGDHGEFGLPVDDDASNDFLVNRTEFIGSFDDSRGIPNWVTYQLESSQIVPGADRCNCFTFDPILEGAGFARYTTADYTGAGAFAGYGIDRGHLARSFDRTSGTLDNARTFYFSNIIPQAADNNQGPWAAHENFLGSLAQNNNKELWITAGASGSIGTVKGEGRITIPAWTWKVSVIAPRGTRLEDVEDYRDLEVIAVVMPNVSGIRNVDWTTSYVVTADSVERLSGYRFLTNLPANIRRALVTGTKPPIAKVVSPVGGLEGTAIAFDASASLDPNGTIVSYDWDFGDGSSGSGATPSHTYNFFGSYQARVVLTDNDGLVDTAYVNVNVTQVTPEQGAGQVRGAITALFDGGVINRGQATSLTAKLDALEASLARGQADVAANQLGALRNEVEAMLRSGRLTAAQAEALQLALERLARSL